MQQHASTQVLQNKAAEPLSIVWGVSRADREFEATEVLQKVEGEQSLHGYHCVMQCKL